MRLSCAFSHKEELCLRQSLIVALKVLILLVLILKQLSVVFLPHTTIFLEPQIKSLILLPSPLTCVSLLGILGVPEI